MTGCALRHEVLSNPSVKLFSGLPIQNFLLNWERAIWKYAECIGRTGCYRYRGIATACWVYSHVESQSDRNWSVATSVSLKRARMLQSEKPRATTLRQSVRISSAGVKHNLWRLRSCVDRECTGVTGEHQIALLARKIQRCRLPYGWSVIVFLALEWGSEGENRHWVWILARHAPNNGHADRFWTTKGIGAKIWSGSQESQRLAQKGVWNEEDNCERMARHDIQRWRRTDPGRTSQSMNSRDIEGSIQSLSSIKDWFRSTIW
jgi:hypothetical protein